MKKRRRTTVIIKQMPKDNVVAEFFCGDSLFGVLCYKKGSFTIEIYPPQGDKWDLDVEDFLALIEQGKKDIMEKLKKSTAS